MFLKGKWLLSLVIVLLAINLLFHLGSLFGERRNAKEIEALDQKIQEQTTALEASRDQLLSELNLLEERNRRLEHELEKLWNRFWREPEYAPPRRNRQ
jgi:DNA anti-recombination protein RmuC